MAGSPTPAGIRIPRLGSVPAAAACTAAIAVLAAWFVFTPITWMYGVPTHGIWLFVLGGSALGVALGARSGRWPVPVVLGMAAIAVAVAGRLLLVAVLRLRLLHTVPAEGLLFVAGIAILAGIAVGRVRRVGTRPGEFLVLAVVAAFLIGDWVVLGTQGMRDLRLYLIAGRHFLDGGQVYATTLMTSMPRDRADLPFLYPPMTLPFFAVLGALPEGLVILGWLAASLGAAVVALRMFAVRWWAIPILLLWPPFFEGLWIGNVAVPALLLFAVGPRLPAALPLSAVFKLQSAVPTLWLVRERRWSSLAISLGLLIGVAVVTLPLVGLDSWRAWLDALRLFQAFEREIPGLYGAALPHYIPYALFLALAVGAVVVAMVFGRGRRGLARFGIASVVASPSLYRHGFLVVLPGLLGNGETLFWLALGLGFSATSPGWWLTAAIAAVGTIRRKPPGPRPQGTFHPLGPSGQPWGPRGETWS